MDFAESNLLSLKRSSGLRKQCIQFHDLKHKDPFRLPSMKYNSLENFHIRTKNYRFEFLFWQKIQLSTSNLTNQRPLNIIKSIISISTVQ